MRGKNKQNRHDSHTHTTLAHTQLCHTHNFVTQTSVCHTHNFVTEKFSIQIGMPRPFCVAGVSGVAGLGLGGIHLRFCVAGVVLMGLGWVTRLGAVGRRVVLRLFCAASVALRDILRRFPWQAWHLAGSTFVLRGRRGIYGTGLGLVTRWGAVGRRLVPQPYCVAGVALRDILRRFTWQAWPLVTSAVVSRGRCGTRRHRPSF